MSGCQPAESTDPAAASSIRGATCRVQPVDQQGSRDPEPGVPAESHAIEASPGEAPQIPEPTQQNARSRTTVRVPRRKL